MSKVVDTVSTEMETILERIAKPLSVYQLWEIADEYAKKGCHPPLDRDLDDWWEREDSGANMASYLGHLAEAAGPGGAALQRAILAVILCVRTARGWTPEESRMCLDDLDRWVSGDRSVDMNDVHGRAIKALGKERVFTPRGDAAHAVVWAIHAASTQYRKAGACSRSIECAASAFSQDAFANLIRAAIPVCPRT